MKSITVGKNDAGQRADRFLTKALPGVPFSLLYKYLRKKRIKRNGGRCGADDRLAEGDVLELYINDEYLAPAAPEEQWRLIKPRLDIIYEDENILLADKRPGMPVHEDESGSPDTLISHIKAYLYQKGEWKPEEENSFAPALCNRIDRNTGGIVVAAKNAEALRIMNEKIRLREVDKYYLCIVHGRPEPAEGELKGYITRDEASKTVAVSRERRADSREARTLYRVLASRGGLSLVECLLMTGRTHQIRAQFAAAGHPLLGDGKYGSDKQNKPYGRSFQALYSYKIRFSFKTPGGTLDYLNGRVFRAGSVDFAEGYGFAEFESKTEQNGEKRG